MHTTVAVSPANRDRLFDLKRQWGLRNMDQVLDRLLEAPPVRDDVHHLYQDHRPAVDEALDRYGITRLIAFGSRARGDHRPGSDLDLAVDVPDGISALQLVHVAHDLRRAFGVPVQLVTLRAAQPRLKAEIERDGVTLYATA